MTKHATLRFNSRNYVESVWELWFRSEPIKTCVSKQSLTEWAESKGYVVVGA